MSSIGIPPDPRMIQWAHAECGVERPDEVSVREASEFIDRLGAVTAG